MNKKYRANILTSLYFIWIMTFWNSFFGIWKNIAPYIFIPISTFVTVWVIFRMIKQTLIYRDLGISWIYLGIISVVTFYKMLNYQYSFPVWVLWLMFIVYCLLVALRILLYNQKDMNLKNQPKRIYHTVGVGTGAYLIIKLLFNKLKTNRVKDYIAIGILVMMMGTLIIIIASIVGSKFIVTSDNQE